MPLGNPMSAIRGDLNLTDFQRAWRKYKESEGYKRSCDAMIKKGIKQPYIDNILMDAFSGAWNLKRQ